MNDQPQRKDDKRKNFQKEERTVKIHKNCSISKIEPKL